ncbi:MAG TPA: molybdopterin oxidoreductase [Gammaproteobacteria bacterium]|nr:molybdopterin oxidoreductase [Gammaproteobacteria bacterium]
MNHYDYQEIEGRSNGYWGILLALGALIAVAGYAWYLMEHNGHWITGMSNQIVWGTPHVFAIFLIVAASGALNVASIASVFGKYQYKPLARLSGLLAIALLAGGLAVLVLDLGRPDRLIIAMTYYNFKSIFAWNIILYNGFFAIVAVYIWTMMQHSIGRYSKPVGLFAFLWRLILTTGTGSIFGFLVARQAYDAAIMAPMFIAMSFSFGLAIFILVLMGLYNGTRRPLGDLIVNRLKNLLGVFIAGVLYFVLAYNLTNLYATEHHGVVSFILRDGGIYTTLFWWGQIVLGSLVPLALLYHPSWGKNRKLVGLAALLVILGGMAQIYVIVIGGQAFPLVIFPGMESSSAYADGVVATYVPSWPEVLLGLGGVAVFLIMVLVAVKVLKFLPLSLEDKMVDPYHKASGAAESASA